MTVWSGRLSEERLIHSVCARKNLRLEIVYIDLEGAETRRTLRPLGLHFWGRVWTLAAWCGLRGGFRTFRVDRIEAAEEAGTFRPERDKSLAAYYALHSSRGEP